MQAAGQAVRSNGPQQVSQLLLLEMVLISRNLYTKNIKELLAFSSHICKERDRINN